jgi:hypothetical protein
MRRGLQLRCHWIFQKNVPCVQSEMRKARFESVFLRIVVHTRHLMSRKNLNCHINDCGSGPSIPEDVQLFFIARNHTTFGTGSGLLQPPWFNSGRPFSITSSTNRRRRIHQAAVHYLNRYRTFLGTVLYPNFELRSQATTDSSPSVRHTF